ncbi:MAG: hypothetical protein CMH27_10160 [Micavibrio sp.]|nr:hypothetical protein [Micavibrio sp.]|tara:strand:- start:298 stop:1224 length:927 start_codon:yes stop_codon:yes gene_type:complete
MRTKSIQKTLLGLGAVSIFALSGCFTGPYLKKEAATRIAAPAWMIERQIDTGVYDLTVFERMHQRNADANIYIEGDGTVWTQERKRSLNPTPMNPVALHMAAHDKADNVAYLARPCQYSDMTDPETPCPQSTWEGGRFSNKVITSMNTALDEIKARYDIENLNLIGYDGGGAIAAILAATRDDVVSLRTVAANLDHEVYTNHHEIAPFAESLNPVDYAAQLKYIPQHHFIGGQDDIMPPTILHSYLQALGTSNCVNYTFIQEAEHEAGWVEKWPALFQSLPSCEGPARVMDFTFDAPDFMERPKPSKP